RYDYADDSAPNASARLFDLADTVQMVDLPLFPVKIIRENPLTNQA
ncbi:11357_t:CDS:1, partial [Gigaspora margarita]